MMITEIVSKHQADVNLGAPELSLVPILIASQIQDTELSFKVTKQLIQLGKGTEADGNEKPKQSPENKN